MVTLNIAPNYEARIKKAYTLIKEQIPEGDIYLFGSYAKRKIKPTSDIDFLVLFKTPHDKNTLRQIKWKVEELIEETLGYEYEIDLKLYTHEHFEKCKEVLGFESEIASYMISLEDVSWR